MALLGTGMGERALCGEGVLQVLSALRCGLENLRLDDSNIGDYVGIPESVKSIPDLPIQPISDSKLNSIL